MFDYIGSTVEEIVEHIKTASPQSVTQAKKYHTTLGNTEVVEKINKARLLARLSKLQERANATE